MKFRRMTTVTDGKQQWAVQGKLVETGEDEVFDQKECPDCGLDRLRAAPTTRVDGYAIPADRLLICGHCRSWFEDVPAQDRNEQEGSAL